MNSVLWFVNVCFGIPHLFLGFIVRSEHVCRDYHFIKNVHVVYAKSYQYFCNTFIKHVEKQFYWSNS